jgi:hypothetical protein
MERDCEAMLWTIDKNMVLNDFDKVARRTRFPLWGGAEPPQRVA